MRYYNDHPDMKAPAKVIEERALVCKCGAKELPYSVNYLTNAVLYACGRVDIPEIQDGMMDEWRTALPCRAASKPPAPADVADAIAALMDQYGLDAKGGDRRMAIDLENMVSRYVKQSAGRARARR